MKCPQCDAEGTLIISFVYQFSHDYKLKRDGGIPKRYKKTMECPEEWSFISCSHCDFYATDQDKNFDYDIVDDKVVFFGEIE